MLLVVLAIAGARVPFGGEVWGLVVEGGASIPVVAAFVAFEDLYFWYVRGIVGTGGFVDPSGRRREPVGGDRSTLFVLGVPVWVVTRS